MKKLLLSLVALLATVGAWAQIEALSDLVNTKSYTIQTLGRGFFSYDVENGDVKSSSVETISNVAPSGTDPNEKFAFLRGANTPEGKYYLYCVEAQKFVLHGSGYDVVLSEIPNHTWTVTKEGDYFFIAKASGEKLNVTNRANGASNGCKVATATPDEGNKMIIRAYAESDDFDPTIALARINMHEGIFPVIGLGYPKESSTAYTNLVSAINGTDKDTYNTALAAYYTSTDVEMPQDGKAYTISAWWKTDGIWPMGWSAANSGTGPETNGKAVYKPLKDNANPSAFVCKYVGGKYVFISDNGYFLSWENDPATGQTSKEYNDAHKFTLEKAVKTGSNIEGELTDLDMFGKFSLKATNGHYLMFSSADRDYHNSNAGSKYYGHTNANTVFFVLEEVDDYKTNTVKLSAQFEDEYISTFYAPYATVLPEGYTAHKATTVNTGTVHLEPIGTEIPANTGVFVTGPANEKVVLSLSTSNPTSPNDNLLDGSAVDTYVAGPAYVLADGENGVGLYKALLNKDANGEAGETHFLNNAGKAYLLASAVAGEARFLVFDFGGNETAIESVEAVENNAIVYDLAGRRVKAAQKGLYIVNGKVVIK